MRSSSSSEILPTIITQPVSGGDLTSPKDLKIDESAADKHRTYSYGHRDFRYGSYRFPTKNAEVSSPGDQQRPIHSKSSSLPNIAYTDVPEESTRKNDEEKLLSSLSKMLDSSVHNNEMQVIRNSYLALLEQAPERTIEGSELLHGYVTSSNHTKFTTHESFKQFILNTSPQSIDNLIAEYNDNIATLTTFKAMILQYIKEEEVAANKALTKMSPPKLQPLYSTQLSPTRKPSTSTKISSKRHKSSMGNIDSGHKTEATVLDIGGSIVPLEIKKQTLYSGSSTSPLDLGALNPDLSVRQEIRCNHCGSKNTPEWRKGLDGNRTLCNACGLFYSKLTKKYNAEEAARIMKERKDTGSVNNRRIK